MGNSKTVDLLQAGSSDCLEEEKFSFLHMELDSGGIAASEDTWDDPGNDPGEDSLDDFQKENGTDDREELINLKVLEEQPQKKLCFCHPDCFANQGNICMALRDTRFGGACCGGNCPFYKSEEQYVRDRKETLTELLKKGRSGLIYHYLKTLDDWELEFLEELTKRGILGDLAGLGAEWKELLAEADRLEEEASEAETDELGTGEAAEILFYDDSDFFADEE